MKYRILMIGLDGIPLVFQDDEDIRTVGNLLDAPTLYDYDLIIIFSVGLRYPALTRSKREEFEIFFSKERVLVIFPLSYMPVECFPIHLPDVVVKKGEVIYPNEKHPFSSIINDITFDWLWHLKGEYCEELIIAKNSPGYAISYEIKLDSGSRIFFLPNLKDFKNDYKRFIRRVINICKSEYLPKKMEKVKKPDWIEDYQLSHEKILQEQHLQIVHLLKKIEIIKQVLYSYGEELSFSAFQLFKEMGLSAKWVERNRKHDIEIDLNGIRGIIEIKGLKKYANNNALRQLLDYCMELERQDMEVKGIFIINHYRDKSPKDRREPFTADAIRIAERNNFCLITTQELFKLYNHLLNRTITIDEIKSKILSSNGRLII